MSTNATATRQPQKKLPLPHIALGIAVTLLLVIFLWRIILAPAKTPPPDTLETAAAQTLQNHYGKRYTLTHLNPGPPLDRAPPPPAATPADDSPISPATPHPAPDGHIHYDATLTTRLAEALYAPVNTPEYIASQLHLDTTAENKIDEILRTPAGPRIRELAGIEPNTDTLASIRLIRETARASTRVDFQAHIDALHTADGWQITITRLTPKTPLPQGDSLDQFTGRLLDITRESDIATLRRLHAQAGETLRRVENARDRHRAELAAAATRAIAAHLANLAPGTLYTGPATIPGQRSTPRLALEITDLDRATATLRAALRADGSWIDARTLEGPYAYNPDTARFTITLAAPAAPPLSTADGITITDGTPIRITLQLNAADLAGDTGAWSCKLTRVPDAARASTIANFSPAEQKLLDATRPGHAYRLSTPGNPDLLLLRYRTQNAATGALTATIEDPRAQWTRELQGTLSAGAARANGYPIRLLSTLDPAHAADPAIGLALRPETGNTFKGTIRMGDTQPLAAEPATTAYLAELDDRAKTRATQRQTAAQDAAAMAALMEKMSAPTRPAPAPAAPKPLDHIPVADGAWIWAETTWNPLPTNNARVVRSTLQKVGGIWNSAISLIKTRPEKQETGTLTFDGADIPPAVPGRDTLLALRATFPVYDGTPAGIAPIEIAPLEIKGKGRKRTAELERLGEAAATFGKTSERIIVDRPAPAGNLYIIRAQRALPPGRYALHAPGHSYEFEIKQ